jgi:hypothetical protein
MMSISLILYIIVTLLWVGLASYIVIRIPACKNVPIGARMFVMAFLIMQLVSQSYSLYSTMTQQHVVKTTNPKATYVNTDKGTVDTISNYLMISFWFSIVLFMITLVVYYILFKTIFMCKDSAVSKQVFWIFFSVTALQFAVASTTKVATNHKLMMNAVAN